MTLPEERNERPWWKWRSREKQARQNLSASVEEALVDPAAQEEDEQVEVEKTGAGALIPPRLSLQSMPLPAVRPGGFVESANRVQAAMNQEMEQQPAPAEPGKLSRFALRLTSSLAALGVMQESVPMLPPPLLDESHQMSRQRDASLLPPAITTTTSRPETSAAHSQAVSATAIAQASVSPLEPAQAGYRPAGPPAKVRLETAVIPATPKPTPPKERREEAREKSAGSHPPVEVLSGRVSETSSRLPVVDRLQAETGVTSAHLPTVDVLNERAATHASLSGSGAFEGGQSDVRITHKDITASSVVLVMLTANPGPVVVQYISLQPQVGFTVHLTAPTTARTAFNYVIL